MKKKTYVLSLLIAALLCSFGCVQTNKAITKNSGIYNDFPVPGRLEGTTAFAHQSGMPKMCNSNYPAWYRGNAPEGLADKNSMHFYHVLIGPGAETGHDAKKFMSGYFELKPGATYLAHNHPSREYYYIIEGEADWYVDDEMRHVTPGAALYHRPYAVHGCTNTSKTEPLRVLLAWWVDEGDSPEVLSIGGKFTNPDLCKSGETAKPHAVPLPPVRKK
jgi:quercetin dioxygenase-like cupin family protein